MPESDEEVEQHLTINNEGRVWFSGYNFGRGGERYEKARSKNFKIDKLAVDKLFGAMAAYFGNEYTRLSIPPSISYLRETLHPVPIF